MRRARRVVKLALLNVVGGLFLVPVPVRNWIYRACGLTIGERTVIFAGQRIRPGAFVIGRRCFINYDCHFDPGPAEIRIEDDVFLSTRVVLIATTHRIGPGRQRAGRNEAAPIVIGRGSWLGVGVTVLPGVRVAPGCVIGAGAVVTRDTDADGLYVGVPARRVRDLPVTPISG